MSNVNKKNQIFIQRKRTRNSKKENGLYTKYRLSDEEEKSDLYQNYLKIEGKATQTERRTYLIKQEKQYKMNKKELPEWAQKELEHLRKIKSENGRRYRSTNYEYSQSQAMKNNPLYKRLNEQLANGTITEFGGELLQERNKQIEYLDQTRQKKKANKEQSAKQTVFIAEQDEYDKYVLREKEKSKRAFERFKRGIYGDDLWKIFKVIKDETLDEKKPTPISLNSDGTVPRIINTINLDEAKEEKGMTDKGIFKFSKNSDYNIDDTKKRIGKGKQ